MKKHIINIKRFENVKKELIIQRFCSRRKKPKCEEICHINIKRIENVKKELYSVFVPVGN